MNIKIIETVSKKKNPDIIKWYGEKLKEFALLLANEAKNETISTEHPVLENKELEVMVK